MKKERKKYTSDYEDPTIVPDEMTLSGKTARENIIIEESEQRDESLRMKPGILPEEKVCLAKTVGNF